MWTWTGPRRIPPWPTPSLRSDATARRAGCWEVTQRPEAPISRRIRGPHRYTSGAGNAAMGSQTPPGRRSSAPVYEHRPRGRDSGRVLVLNATYEPINVCTVRRAAILLLKSKAELLEHAQ